MEVWKIEGCIGAVKIRPEKQMEWEHEGKNRVVIGQSVWRIE